MTIHEFGIGEKSIVLVHPSVVMWDYFEYIIPLLQEDYRLIIPALPGYDEEHPDEDFTSVEEIAAALSKWLTEHGINTVDILYGCSMGGQYRAANAHLWEHHSQNRRMRWRYHALSTTMDCHQTDRAPGFFDDCLGEDRRLKVPGKVFSTDEYSAEDLKYIAKILRFISCKTIWLTFESCNNYTMPDFIPTYPSKLQYWYGGKEEKERAWDIRYVKEHFPDVELVKLENMGHASMASLHPGEMVERLRLLATANTPQN